MNSRNEINLNPGNSNNTYPLSGIFAMVCSAMAALILAGLISFGLMGSCSPTNIAIFIGLLGLSAVLAFLGVIISAVSYRKAKNRPALFSLLFAVIYVALLIYFLQLIYS